MEQSSLLTDQFTEMSVHRNEKNPRKWLYRQTAAVLVLAVSAVESTPCIALTAIDLHRVEFAQYHGDVTVARTRITLYKPELSMGWVGSRVFSFWWVGLGPLQQKY